MNPIVGTLIDQDTHMAVLSAEVSIGGTISPEDVIA
jgi:hypothetical protein